MPRARDLGFEALVEVTGANVSVERGALNAALKAIREQVDDIEGELLADVIREMAARYRRLWPEMTLTPTALAKHWNRILTEEQERAKPVVYVTSDGLDCSTCGNLRSVLVGYRPAFPTLWTLAHRSKTHPEMGLPHPAHRRHEDGYEIWAPCPDCNPQAIETVQQWRNGFERRHPERRLPRPPVPVSSNMRSREEE